MKRFPSAATAILLLLLPALPGCEKKPSAAAAAVPSPHRHHPPHDGTPVELGREAFHLELVRDAAAGKLSAFVLDGEMEDFIRVTAPAFEMVATVDGAKQVLTFHAVADSATGESVGDTALFETTAGWLKTTGRFDAVLTQLEVRGTVYTNVRFNFPNGNDKD
jgi:hypothetical protein